MSKVTLGGNAVEVSGIFPSAGQTAKDFTMVRGDLSEAKLSDYAGKKVILNIFPSLDTAVCATSVRKFNQLAAGRDNTVVLAISKDLPFAQGRFCTTEGIANVVPLSAFRNTAFGEDYGVAIADGPLAGLLARAVIVIGTDGRVLYSQLVPEITTEPDYEAAVSVL